jgi:hypothetical protein
MRRLVLASTLALFSCSPDYQSGSTECSIDGTCPSGFVCGGASTAGALDICYSKEVAKECIASYVYYCPASSTCWPAKVACDSVINCGNGQWNACDTEGQLADCSGSGTCVWPGSGGSGGGGTSGSGGSTGTSSVSIKFCHALTSGGQSMTLTLNINGSTIATTSGSCNPVSSCLAVPARTAAPISLMNGSTTLASGTIDLTAGMELLIRATLDSSNAITLESNRAGGICSGGNGTSGTLGKFCNFLYTGTTAAPTDVLLTLYVGGARFSAMSGTCSPISSCTSIQSGTNVSLSLLDGSSTVLSGTYPTINSGANMVFRADLDDSGSPNIFGSSYSTGLCSPATAPHAANHMVFPTSSSAGLQELAETELSLVSDSARNTTHSTLYRSIADGHRAARSYGHPAKTSGRVSR